MSDLSELLEQVGEQVQQNRAERDAKIAAGVVDASRGDLSGFTTESGTDENGELREQTIFHRAKRNVNLAAGMNSEAVGAAVRASIETGFPVNTTMQWDNQRKKHPDVSSLAPETQEFLGEDLTHAAISKDDVENIDALVQTAKYAMSPLAQRRQQMQDNLKAEGYSAAQLADLAASGIRPEDGDPTGKKGVFHYDVGGEDRTTEWPMLEKWYENPVEQEFIDSQRKAADELVSGQYDDKRGSAWLLMASPEEQANYIRQLDKEIAVMKALSGFYGDAWTDFSDEELQHAINTVGNETGVDVTDVSVKRIRPEGVGWQTDWAETFNFFGVQDFWKRMTGPSKEELNLIHKDPLFAGWSVMDRLDLIDELEKQAMDLRGKTLANNITEGTLSSVKFGLELWAGGIGQAYETATSEMLGHGIIHAVKTAPRAFWGLMKAAANILPGRSITAADKAIEKVGGQISATIQDGEVVPEYDEGEIGDLAKEIINAFLDQYIEDVSEGVGEFLPSFSILGRAVPKKLQKAAFVKAAKETLQRFAGKKGVKQVLDIMQKMGWHGIPAEWFEEIMGDVMRYGVTGAAEALGTGVGDLGQNTIFNGWDAETERLLQIAVTGTVIPAVAYGASETVNALNRVSGAQKTKQFQATVSTLKERVDAAATAVKNSPEVMEYLLRKMLKTSGFAYLTPEAAGALFQSIPDTMRNIGVTEETIGKATTEERLVPVSVPALLVRGSAEEVNQVLASLIPDPRSMLTPDDADKILPSEMDDAMKKSAEELKDKEAAIQEKMEELRAAGRPQNEVRAFSKLLQFADYFAAHNTDGMTAAEWIRNFKITGEAEEDFLKRLGATEPSLYQGVIGIPGFYSNMMQSLEDAPQQKMTPAQWMAYLQKSGGLKAGETSWRGSVEKFFEGRDPNTAVDKQELVDAFQDGMVDILEIEGIATDEKTTGKHLLAEYVSWYYDYSKTTELENVAREFRAFGWREAERKTGVSQLVYIGAEQNIDRISTRPEFETQRGVNRYIATRKALFDLVTKEWLQKYTREFESDAEDAMANMEVEMADVAKKAAEEYDRTHPASEELPSVEPMEGADIRSGYTTEGLINKREIVIYSPELVPWDATDGIHFGKTTEGKAIVWVRFGETTDKDGKRVLVIDEIQSNRHQKGREKGYSAILKPDGEFGTVDSIAFDGVHDDLLNGGVVLYFDIYDLNQGGRHADFGIKDGVVYSYDSYREDPAFEALVGKDVETAFGPEAAAFINSVSEKDMIGKRKFIHPEVERNKFSVPAAPFEKNWNELGMKRMIRYAAEHGFDKIAWTSGNQQAVRYNIGNVLDSIVSFSEEKDGNPVLEASSDRNPFAFSVSPDGKIAWSDFSPVEGKSVHEVFGKEVGNMIMDLINGKGGKERSWWVGGLMFQYDDESGNAVLSVNGEHDFVIRIDRDGLIVSDSVRYDYLKGDTVFDVFGEYEGKRILEYAFSPLRDRNSLTLEEGAYALLAGKELSFDKDVIIGGEGMKTFYDKILKSFTEKYIKKWGSKVGVVELPDVEEVGREMWGFDVTPAMKAAVMGRGQPLFQSRWKEDPERIARGPEYALSADKQAKVERERAAVRAKYEGTDQWMKAPNGEKSKLTEDQWVTVRTESFKKWFGDWEKEGAPVPRASYSGDSAPVTPGLTPRSQVSQPYQYNTPKSGKSQIGLLDENGEPLVVYHGTPDRFDVFRYGDTGFHFGSEEQAIDRVTDKKGANFAIYLLGGRKLVENAGIYAGFVKLRTPYYIPGDLISFLPHKVAWYLLSDRAKGTIQLTEEDIAFLKEIETKKPKKDPETQEEFEDGVSDSELDAAKGELRSWFKKKGYDGIVYENAAEAPWEEDNRSYIIFDPKQFKAADNLGTFNPNNPNFYYQTGEKHRGAMTMDDDWKATIALFEGMADGSTAIHETAHYVFDMMEHFVESGLADERMKSDYRKLVDWMTLTPEQAAKGYEAYLKTVPDGTDAMSLEQWKYVEEQERFARGFEAYCMEGRAPSVELQGAFATLRRILLHIYKTVRALGVQLTDDVRQVFDGMLATETTLLRDSILLEAAEQIDRELLGLSQAEVKTFRDLIQKSNEQAIQEMTAEKNRQLTELRKQWRAEAKELMADDLVYSVWYAVQKEGKMDYLAVQEIAGDYIAQRLRSMGLVTAPGRRRKDGSYPNAKAGKHPATMAAQAGFDSVEEMIDQLLASKSPQDFTAEYMADEERKFNAEFEMSEKAQSVQASIEALEKLSEMLAVKGGQIGYRFRRALLKQQAIAELNSMSVAHIVSDKKLIADCRMNARALTKAANEGDFKGAFEHAKALRFNLEVLRMKGDARKSVADGVALLRKGRHAKKGTIYGDHQEALMDLSFRFGFTNNLPKIQHDVASVVREFNEEAEANNDMPLDVPDWMLNFSMDYRKMTFGQFQELKNLADFLYGEGKELVSAREETFRNSVKAAVEGTVAELKDQKHKYTRSTNFIVKGWRGMANWGTKLRNIVGMAVNWNPDSTLQKLYDEMAYAESEQTQIMADPMRQATAALDALYKATRGLNLESISDIPFPQDVKAEGYRKWDAEKVVAACLNMGTLKNKQRLIDGYEWGDKGDEYVDRIASLLSAEDWANIQAIWNAISSLTPRTARAFKEEYHYDLKLEEAVPFSVKTSDGQEIDVLGGYYPLEYLYHKNTVVNDKVDALKNAPKFRRASFTFERNEKVTDPLALSLNTVFNHIFDASHYISHRHVMRKVLRVINDRAFRSNFQQTQGFERYAALKALIENVAAPGAALKGMTSEFENWGRAVVTASALWASPSVVAMQLSSITYGLDELGGYYLEAASENMAHPIDTFKFVMEHSGMMRDRVNLKDLDLKTRANEFRANQAQRIRNVVTQIGYSPMRFVDLAVAIPAWKGAYDKALDEGKSDSQAVAAADEFVAKTQGATRAIDLSPLQLKPWGRGLTVFFSAVSAGSTMGTRTISKIFGGKMTAGEAAYSATMNLVLPLLFSCLIRYAVSGAGGGDDPDKARRAFLRELMTNPFQGIPVVRDVADFAAGRVLNPSGKTQRTVFENTSLRGASDLVVTAFDGVEAAFEENPDRAMYKLADAVGTLFQVPVVRVYERLRQMLVDWTGDEKILPDIDEETKHKKSNKKRRRH